jgi:hypothetical protein
VLLLLVAAALGAPAGGDPPAPARKAMERWRKISRWEGSWQSVYTVSNNGRTFRGSATKTATGHVLLDEVQRTETLPGDQTPGWTGATVWKGKSTAHVTIRAEGTMWGAKGELLERTTREGSATTESPAELAIGAVKGFVHGKVNSPTIDVTTTIVNYLGGGSRTRQDRDWIDLGRVGGGEDRPFWGRPPEEGFVLSGSYHGRRESDSGDGTVVTTSVVTWTFWPSEEVDFVVDVEDYETWLPEGDLSDPTRGNHVRVKATLETRDGKPSTKRKTERVIFQLVECSKEPGVCMNVPVYTVMPLGELDDLYFDFSDQAEGYPEVLPGERRADVMTKGGNSASLEVHARDFGAHGKLRVVAIMEGGGGEIVGHLRGDPSITDIPLPRTDPGSAVARVWKEQKKVAAWADDRDDEAIGGYLRPGDGLSLYEEYRGFSVRGEHERTEPARKTLFVHTKVPRADGGLRALSAASGIQVLRIDEREYRSNKYRLVNFNHGLHHLVDQHGLWIVSSRLGKDVVGQSPIGPPVFVDKVRVNTDNLSWDRRYRDSTIAHELCHALAVRHHGDGDRKQTFTRGELPPFPRGGKLWVAVQQGQHSGVEQCMMRYCVADLIERTNGTTKTLELYGPVEPDGLMLCTTDVGTGVNDPKNPRNKCGNATTGRGICLGRLTVSDVYPQGGG